MIVGTTARDGLRIITMDDGKLNCVALPLRIELLRELDAAAADQTCKAVVLIGNDRTFSAGADLNELDGPVSFADPMLHDTVLGALDNMPMPVVAAIRGNALGGGLELAMGCHYRVAEANAMVGLPEVSIGLMPGAGGTQRLPRAVGLEPALNMMLSGQILPAGKAPEGLFDHIADADLLEAAVSFAQKIADVRPLPRLIDKTMQHENYQGYLQFARGAAKMDPRRAPGLLPIIDAAEQTFTHPPQQAIRNEYLAFREIAFSEASAPFRYAFLSERKVASIPGVNPKSGRDIKSAAVIGAGTMGAGIAISLVEAGISVTLLDLNQEALDKGIAHCAKTWDKRVAKGRLKEAKRDGYLAALSKSDSYDAISDCDLVIEAVVENIGVKKAVFEQLDAIMKSGAVLATNTSTLDVNEIAAVTKRPADVLGLHFFSPANIMKLLEVVRGAETSNEVLATALSLAKRLRKVPVVAGVCYGFIANRMIDQYLRQAMFLVEEGATPAQVDKALTKWGMAMGPFAMSDVVGNDVTRHARDAYRATFPDTIMATIPDRVCDKGWFGRKTGMGWYDYSGRKPKENPELGALIQEVSDELGLKRRKVSDEEIVQRCIFALINEAAAILDEGIAQRGSDIDMIYLMGFGFPRFRGGPLFFADHFGLRSIIRQMPHFAAIKHGDPSAWEPHPLLIKLAESGEKISKYEVSA
jgi:3-hydroxyacyl-CoA dehydrogenase